MVVECSVFCGCQKFFFDWKIGIKNAGMSNQKMFKSFWPKILGFLYKKGLYKS